MEEPLSPNHPKNYDVKCLRCGAMNLPENHICGRCGASLPLVYDAETGAVRQLEELRASIKKGTPSLRRPQAVQWILRLGVLFLALVMAWVIMHRR